MSKIRSFIEKMYRGTIDGNINWEETQYNGIYQSSFPNYSIHIMAGKENNDTPYIEITIYNDEGKVIETIRDDDDSLRDMNDSYQRMEEIYETARSQAMGLEKALDDIIDYLDKIPPF